MRKHLIMGLLLLATTAGAVKMKPGAIQITQRDGTTLTVRAFGDADISYYLASDGTLLYLEGTDYYVAHVDNDGILTPTNVLAHEPAMRTPKERAIVKNQNRERFFSTLELQAKANKMKREPMAADASLLPHLGSPKVPVILVEFSDTTFKVPDVKTTFDKYLNAKDLFSRTTEPVVGRNYGSVARYFSDMSNGKFTPQFDVYGPVKLGKPLKAYGAGPSSSERMDSLLHDACTAVDDSVDFKQYDANNDGNIDLVYIIYAGYSQSIAGNSSDCIHPKSGVINISKSFDGVKVCRYGVNNELNGTPANQEKNLYINGIGLFCHEFSHCLGLPDMYPASGTTARRLVNQNMEYWDLMDGGEYTNNGYNPTEYTAWERERMEWMTIDTLYTAANVELKTLSEGGKAYRILNDKDETGHEYYIVENVQQKGWNKRMLGHGMMVSHVDYSDSQFTLGGCKVNATPGHPRMTILPADGIIVPEDYIGVTIAEGSTDEEKTFNADFYNKYNGQTFTREMYMEEAAGDLYPGTMQITSLTDTSAPTMSWVYTGDTMGKPITDIAEDTETGTVSFKFMGGVETDIKNVKAYIAEKSAIYSLDGKRLGTDVNALQKGIYIIGGKKIVK